MRFRHLLLEYSREKTLQNWRDRLRARLAGEIEQRTVGRDHDVWRPANNYFVQTRAGRIPEEELDKNDARVMELIEQSDPTPNNEYVQWLVQRYLSKGIVRFEDMFRAYEALLKFHRLKTSGYFKRNPDKAQLADIGRFKTLSELGIFLHQLNAADLLSVTAQERAMEAEMIENGEAIILADTPTLKVVIPRSHKAACWWGKNTQWCTASSKDAKLFNHYNSQGPLYVVLDKPTNRRWQLHFESAQFMDENDNPIRGWNNFPMEAFDAIDVKRISDEGKFETFTEVPDGDELPDEIMIKMAQSCGHSVMAASILGSAGFPNFTQMMVEALPGKPNFTIVTRKTADGNPVEILDYHTDILSFLRHNWKGLDLIYRDIWHAMSIDESNHGTPGLRRYLVAFNGNSHIISFRDEWKTLVHMLVNRGKVSVIRGLKMESGALQLVQRSELNMQLKFLRAKNATKTPHYDAALMYILKKAEMLDEDGNLPVEGPKWPPLS